MWPWGLAQVSETLEAIALAILIFMAVRAVRISSWTAHRCNRRS
jgi:hypothetical protein